MSKAKDRAFEVYPDFKVGDSFSSVKLNKQRKLIRHGFIEGYHQAEKDLELKWQDMMTIDDLLDELLLPRRNSDELVLKGYYEQVLKRFKDLKYVK